MKQRWIGLALSVALLAACEGGGGSAESSSMPLGGPAEADDPTPPPTPVELGIFADVRGWIAYGNDEGIWAVNPTGGMPPVQLSERTGDPVVWSADGQKLLISREVPDPSKDPVADLDLFVLSADGTTTRLTWNRDWGTGSISPDGSKVIYDKTTWRPGEDWRSGIYEVNSDGGAPRILLAAGLQDYPDGTTARTALFHPTFSPDGRQIAYLDGMGDWGNTIRVMNASGSGSRMLVGWSPVPRPEGAVVAEVEGQNISCCVSRGAFAWSGDGERLAFQTTGEIWIVDVDGDGFTRVGVGGGMRWSPTAPRLAFRSEGGIWVANADGSGLAQVVPVGYDPVWSPDGDQIAYREGGSLYVVDANGMNVRTLVGVEPTATNSSCAQQETPHCYAPVVWNPTPASASGS